VSSKEVPGLFAISTGPVPPNPSELMLSPRVNHLLEELKEAFDFVLIDIAPQMLIALGVLLIAESFGLWFVSIKLIITENSASAAN
jgi:Mrp family chromosome partitioning ATPase